MHVPRATLAIYFHKEIKLDSLIALSVIMVGIYEGPSLSGGVACKGTSLRQGWAADVLPRRVHRAGRSARTAGSSQGAMLLGAGNCPAVPGQPTLPPTPAPGADSGQRGCGHRHPHGGNHAATLGAERGPWRKILGPWKRSKFSRKSCLRKPFSVARIAASLWVSSARSF